MNPVWIIAKNTFKEVIRDRILYGLFLFAVILITVSLAMGQLSYAEQARISANFGLTAIHLSAIGLAIFIGANLVLKELEKQTVLVVLVRPLSRPQFILGKFLGLSLVIATVMLGLAVILSGIFLTLGMGVQLSFALVLFGIFLEALSILSFTVFFSMFARPILVVCFSIGVFMVGHWLSSLRYFVEKVPDSSIAKTYKVLHYLVPDFDAINWKSLVVYNDPVHWPLIGESTLYIALWIVLLLAATIALFRRKDLV